jgi:hypothetical protein
MPCGGFLPVSGRDGGPVLGVFGLKALDSCLTRAHGLGNWLASIFCHMQVWLAVSQSHSSIDRLGFESTPGELGRMKATALIVEQVERLRCRISSWNGKAGNTQITMQRIRKVMHVFGRESGHRGTTRNAPKPVREGPVLQKETSPEKANFRNPKEFSSFFS